MLNKSQTLTDFLLHEEITSPPVNGSLTMVLLQIENSVKIIGSHIKQSGLVDILGKTGYKNAFNDEVQRFDDLSNTLLVTTLLSSGEVYAVASEELKEPIYSKNKGGDFIVCIDPLDGSSNVDCNASLGTIFSIYKKGDNILQKGNDQIAAGYVLYGPSIMFVLTTGKGVNGFTLDPSIGSFLLSHSNIIIPEKGSQYAINEGYSSNFTNQTKNFLKALRAMEQNFATVDVWFQMCIEYLFKEAYFFILPIIKTQTENLDYFMRLTQWHLLSIRLVVLQLAMALIHSLSYPTP